MAKKLTPEAHPNRGSAARYALLKLWAEQLGVEIEDVLKRAGEEVSRTTLWRLEKGTASVSTARTIERALDALEKKRAEKTEAAELVSLASEWENLGYELARTRPDALRTLLETARRIAETERTLAKAKHQLLHPLPPRDE